MNDNNDSNDNNKKITELEQMPSEGIKGVRRRKTAEESSELWFHASKSIISKFRRESDRIKIYEIAGRDSNLTDLLIAAAVIHLYYYNGIRTMNPLEISNIDVSNIKNIEFAELKNLFQEFKLLIGDSIEYELKLNENSIKLLEKILEYIKDLNEPISNEKFEELTEYLENNITEILQKYPYIMFFDYIGTLLGYKNQILEKIIEESSSLKVISQDIEKEIIEGGRKDLYLELSALDELITKLKENFEFESKKDLQSETVSLKQIAINTLKNLLNIFPVSKRALEIFFDALNFKKELIAKFSELNKTKIDYESFENGIMDIITKKIGEICNKGSTNHLIYFLQFIMDKDFSQIIELFNRFGIVDIFSFSEQFIINRTKISQMLGVYGIQKIDILKISNPLKDPINLAEIQLYNMKKVDSHLNSKTISDLFDDYNNNKSILEKIANEIHWNLEDLYKFYRKKKIIQIKLIESNLVSSYYSLLTFFDFENMINNLVKEIFFYLFSNFTLQISRILETYLKLKEDIGILLLGLKKIKSSLGIEQDWVIVKIEELMIERIMKRQKELSLIFNAENNPFLVNGFILARYTDSTLNNCQKLIKDEPSFIYKGIKNLSLPSDMVSPVSYCIAYDIFERYKFYQEQTLMKVEKTSLEEKLKIDKQKEEIFESQKENTLNWIEKKITSSIMRISSKGINPTTLYWSEKDTQSCRDNILLHIKTKGSILMGLIDFYSFTLKKMKELWPETKIQDENSIRNEIIQICVKIISKRLKKTEQEIDENIINTSIIEGEQISIAEELAKSICQKLDKILYKKFKQTLNQ